MLVTECTWPGSKNFQIFRNFFYDPWDFNLVEWLKSLSRLNSNAKCTVICLNAIVLARSISDD